MDANSTSIDATSPTFRITAGFITFLISSYGITVNLYVFNCFTSSSKFRTDFYIFCTSRTISNSVICLVFLVWSSPCTIIGNFYLPTAFNKMFGLMSGYCSYVSGQLVQFVISINRFCVSFWPLGGGRFREKYGLYIGLGFAWSLAGTYTLTGIPKGCGFVYNIDNLSWLPEDKPCAVLLADVLLYCIYFLATTSNTLNVFTFFKLVYETKRRLLTLTSKQSQKRQRQRIKMFAQSFTQDMLYVIDITVGWHLSQLYDAPWFTFLTTSVSWLSCPVLDGTVMVLFNKEIHPKFKIKKALIVTVESQGAIKDY